jgi:hypothetical protein
MTRFHQFLNKRRWKKHLQKHFEKQKKKDCSEFQRLDKIKVVICFDSRCALFFDSMRNFQFHCQDVHCVDRIKKITTKKRRCTSRSKMNVFSELHSHLESKHNYAFIEKKIFFRCANKLTNTLALESTDLIYSIELIESNEQSHDVRSSVSFAYSANFKFSETNWHFEHTRLDIDTSTSFVVFDSFLDLRLRDKSISIESSTVSDNR